jgi:hypothetical protein
MLIILLVMSLVHGAMMVSAVYEAPGMAVFLGVVFTAVFLAAPELFVFSPVMAIPIGTIVGLVARFVVPAIGRAIRNRRERHELPRARVVRHRT